MNLAVSPPTRGSRSYAERVAKPAILAVDDDPPVSAAIARDLRARYGADYRVVRATSGAEALDAPGPARAARTGRSRSSPPTSGCPG